MHLIKFTKTNMSNRIAIILKIQILASSYTCNSIFLSLYLYIYFFGRPSDVVVRRAGCYTKGPGFESRVRHGCQTVRPRSYQWLSGSAPNTGRREGPGSNLALVDLAVRSFPWFSPKLA